MTWAVRSIAPEGSKVLRTRALGPSLSLWQNSEEYVQYVLFPHFIFLLSPLLTSNMQKECVGFYLLDVESGEPKRDLRVYFGPTSLFYSLGSRFQVREWFTFLVSPSVSRAGCWAICSSPSLLRKLHGFLWLPLTSRYQRFQDLYSQLCFSMCSALCLQNISDVVCSPETQHVQR